MKKFWMNTIPALLVIFVLVFGFAAFHVQIQNAEASGSGGTDCVYRTAQCRTESENVTISCNTAPVNQQRCSNARKDYDAVCTAASNACN